MFGSWGTLLRSPGGGHAGPQAPPTHDEHVRSNQDHRIQGTLAARQRRLFKFGLAHFLICHPVMLLCIALRRRALVWEVRAECCMGWIV